MKKRIFSFLMAVVMLCSLLPMNALAVRAEDWPYQPPTPTSGTIGQNISWKVDTSTGVATFTGTGDIPDWTDRYNYPDYLEYARTVVISEGITSIGASRFASSKKLEKVILPTTVTKIGDKAFAGCTHLAKVEMCEGVTKIGANAFQGCTALVKLDFPDSITQIGEYAFYGCTGMPDFDWPESLVVIDRFAFYGCTKLTNVVLPKGLEEIGNYAFTKCSGLEAVTIPSGVIFIGNHAFEECTKLNNVLLPDALIYLGESAFYRCDSLTKIAIPEGFEEIPNSAFGSCDQLEKIYIPESVYFIGSDAFGQCQSLYEIYFGGSEDDWSNISIVKDENWYSDSTNYCCNILKRAVKYYNVEGPECVLIDHTESIAPAVAASCESAGKTEGSVCSACGKVLKAQADIPAKGHDYVATITKAASCSETGVMTYVCKNDKSHTYTEEIAKKAHAVVVDSAVAATCTAAGKTEGKHCSVCNEVIVKQETIPAKAHTVVIDQGYAATCTKAGKTEGKHCSVCGTVIVKQEVIPAKGHKGGSPVKETVKTATCETDGEYVEVVYCTVCGMALSHNEKTVPATGHKDGDKNYKCDACGKNLCTEHKTVAIPAVAPTCTKDGLTEGSKCGNCGEILKKQEAVPAKGHTAVVDKAVAATCTAAGKTEGKHCSVCSEVLVKQEAVPAKGHAVVVDKAVAATCTTAGKTEGKHCYVCGAITVKQETVPAKGHTEVVDKGYVASCVAAGKTDGKHCGVCGIVTVKQEVIPKKAHTPVVDNAVAPTCTASGKTEGAHCVVCGTVAVKQEVIPAKGHTAGAAVKENNVAASCDKTGSYEEVVYCSVCKTEMSRIKKTVPALGHKDGDKNFVCDVCGVKTCTNHKVETVKGVAATCTKDGLSDGSKCGNCGEVLKKQEVIPAKGHTVVVDRAVAATCTIAGKTEGKHCSVCNTVLTKQEVIPAKGHTAGVVVKENNVAASCDKTGSYEEVVYCSVCKAEMSRIKKTVPAVGHKDGDKNYKCDACGVQLCTDHKAVTVSGYAATCIKDGLTDGSKCGNCGEVLKKQEAIPAKGHSEVVVAGQQATCESNGLTDGVACSVCNAVLVKQSAIPARGHMEAVLAAVAPTCTEDGKTEGKLCSVCGKIMEAPKAIPAKGHVVAVVAGKSATCTEEGLTEGRYCRACDAVIAEQKPLPVRAHKFSNGKCSVCGEKDPDYIVNENPFVDVGMFDWYYGAVLWAVQNNITGGTSANTFSPANPCTRAQVVQFLWAANGRPEPTAAENPFTDVSENDWYYKAVLWAVERGITGGTSATTFSPGQTCTRAQVVTFLWASAGKPGVSGANLFSDVPDGAWYTTPVLWAVEKGITSGVGEGVFGPDQSCTRAQIALFLYKAMSGK